MAGNENRRRKKIEAQRAKRKDKQRAVARIQSSGKMARMTTAKNWPIIETLIDDSLDDQGIASVYISRQGPHDQVAAAVFLVDAYCLGVKDVSLYFGPAWKWKESMQLRRERDVQLKSISPEALRKLVESAVAYANSLGIAPHRDWFHACPILGDIDASTCTTEFEFGRDGKPFYVAGPYDTPQRIRQIMAALDKTSGDGNYHFTLPMSNDDGFLDDEEFDDEDEGFDDEDRLEEDSVITIEKTIPRPDDN